MPFARLDSAAVARALSQIADRPGDLADLFLERREEIELPPPGSVPGLRAWRESGLAVRLLRDGTSWLASRDELGREVFHDALKSAARARPRTPFPELDLAAEPWGEAPRAPEVLEFPSALESRLRAHRAGIELELTVRRHRRWVRVVGTQLAGGVESESFYSLRAETAAGGAGFLLTELGDGAAERVARSLVRAHQARQAAPPERRSGVAVLGPAATAVLLHEAVAHALEADTLALDGDPEAALGGRLGSAELDVFDDPQTAPPAVRRAADDEGFPAVRRCLLRAGVVEQPLCDVAWARRSEALVAGAGRRGSRHLPPGPRSYHLELVPGALSARELLDEAEGGLYLPEAERGRLDPLSGEFRLRFPYGLRIENAHPGPTVGPCSLSGPIRELLSSVAAVGREVRSAGAGWCAKGGVKLPVWATAPELRLEGVEIRP